MTIIAAVDDQNGMMFNNRRQSRDRTVLDRIAWLAAGHWLWMNEYSAKLFAHRDDPLPIQIDRRFLTLARRGELCFVEDESLLPYKSKIEQVILFRWNKTYPADTFFELDLSASTLISQEDFPGYSHEKITMEVYDYVKA